MENLFSDSLLQLATADSSPPFRQVFAPLCSFPKTKKTLKPALKRAGLQGFIYPADMSPVAAVGIGTLKKNLL